MKLKNIKLYQYLLFILMIIVMVIFSSNLVFATDNGNCLDYAWFEQIGFVSANGTGATVDYGVTVADDILSGYAWSEKLGWINFNDVGAFYSVINDGSGNLSGYAWSEKGGYISFDDSTANDFYQVKIDVNGNFSGYAWSEKLGYVNMDDVGALYKVTTTWIPPSAPTVTNLTGASNITDSSARLNGELMSNGKATTTVYIYWGDDDASTATSTWDNELNLGDKSAGTFYTDIINLTSGKNYFYRCYAENSIGSDWAGETARVRSLNISSPIIFKSGVILKKNVIIK